MTSARKVSPVRPPERFLVFGAPQIHDDEIDEVVASMRAAWLGSGPKVARFEDDFRTYTDAPFAAALNSCTAALHLAARGGVGPGDEVITTPLTFCATVNSIIHCGATPVLVDVDPQSMNISPGAIATAITPRTKAVIPVHFAGRPCEIEAIASLCRDNGLRLIEDCAHAIETRYHGRQAGTFGDVGCFSFYATKNLTTGEGGMVISAQEDLVADVKVRALHGLSRDAWRRFSDSGYRHYQVVAPGFKYGMMDLQAAIGLHQLRRLEDNLVRRVEVWEAYQSALADLPLTLPSPPKPDTRHARHLYTVLVEDDAGVSRDEFLEAMTAHGIGVGVHYQSMGEHEYYQHAFGWAPEMWPIASDIGRRTVSLPLSARLTDDDVSDVIEAVRRTVG